MSEKKELKLATIFSEKGIFFLSLFLAIAATIYSYYNDYIIAYGDAESHLNIAKRVVHGLTPGLAQLGGVWLPLPHILMAPFVYFDPLWQSGIAGSIVSGAAYVVTSLYIYKLIKLITKSNISSFLGSLVFVLNPNILYLQSTPMTEPLLICFVALSTYYYCLFFQDDKHISHLIKAALFCFCASLSRYDGWFLFIFESAGVVVYYLTLKARWKEFEGKLIIFCTVAGLGILLWFSWCWLILGDPFYFKSSHFSAFAQQLAWKQRGQLPAYHNAPLAFAYYFVDSLVNAGPIPYIIGLLGMLVYLIQNHSRKFLLFFCILLTPFVFNVVTLYLGESIIFIPQLTPDTFYWRIFNVRYGLIFLPVIAFFIGYLLSKVRTWGKVIIVVLFLAQIGLFATGRTPIITLDDGVKGLSRGKRPDAEVWIKKHYDHGLVLIDDFSRSISLVRSHIKMQEFIYIGNKPYWEESLREPEKYARWIVMQKDDEVWKHLYDDPKVQGRLYKYFSKAYTSPEILIFKRNK